MDHHEPDLPATSPSEASTEEGTPAVSSESPVPEGASLDSVLRKIKHPNAAVVVEKKEPAPPPGTSPASAQRLQPAKTPAESQDADETDWPAILAKKDRTLQDTQKWGMQQSNKLKAYEQLVKRYQDEGILGEEEAKTLVDLTQSKDGPPEALHPLVRYGHVWDTELPSIRKYSTASADLDAHVLAFQNFLQMASPDEVEGALQDLATSENDPVQNTKRMLELGKAYYDEVFKDVLDSGGLRQLKATYQQEIQRRDQTIDKLQRELAKLKIHDSDGLSADHSYGLPPGQSAKAPVVQERSLGAVLGRVKQGRVNWE